MKHPRTTCAPFLFLARPHAPCWGMAACVAVLLALPSARATRHPIVPGEPQKEPIVLVGATLHPMTGPAIPGGMLLFAKGKIVAIGKNIRIPPKARRIDLRGQHVYPGWIHARTDLGLTEIGSVRGTLDRAETGTFNPNVRAQVAFHPDSELIPVARTNGVLLAHVVPSSGILSGQSAVMMLDGWTWESMTLRAPAGMIVRWPRLSSLSASWRGKASKKPASERARLELEQLFDDALAYEKARKADRNQAIDARLEALLPVLRRKVPLMAVAQDEATIRSAVAFAARRSLRLVIIGGHDAEACAGLLRRHDVPVIVEGTYRLPRRRDEPYDVAYTLPARLHRAGVRFCIAGSGRFNASNARNLPYDAAFAVAYGLPRSEALKAISLYPARILGIADRVGSLEAGKDATLIVCDGDPLEIPTRVVRAWIAGREVKLDDRHQRLWRKYRRKYERMGILKE